MSSHEVILEELNHLADQLAAKLEALGPTTPDGPVGRVRFAAALSRTSADEVASLRHSVVGAR